MARITYYGELVTKYFDHLVASDSLLPFLKDNGEQKRIGTLLVFVDEGVENDTPILALPINLSLLLDMPDDKAYVGFTSSTGTYYEKHDILSWIWCDEEPCEEPKKSTFDYHQKSKFSSANFQRFAPGAGYGGAGETTGGFPIQNTNPDTTAWSVPIHHYAEGRNDGLATTSDLQIPPATLY
jgi:hypothetical protein